MAWVKELSEDNWADVDWLDENAQKSALNTCRKNKTTIREVFQPLLHLKTRKKHKYRSEPIVRSEKEANGAKKIYVSQVTWL